MELIAAVQSILFVIFLVSVTILSIIFIGRRFKSERSQIGVTIHEHDLFPTSVHPTTPSSELQPKPDNSSPPQKNSGLLSLLDNVSTALQQSIQVSEPDAEPSLPYIKKPYFMTKAENICFRILETITPKGYLVIPQVNLDKLLYVEKDLYYWKTYRNKIVRKSVDFVIIDRKYFVPILAIELDDYSHKSYKRIERDLFVEKVFRDAGMKLLRINRQTLRNTRNLKQLIEENLRTPLQNDQNHPDLHVVKA